MSLQLMEFYKQYTIERETPDGDILVSLRGSDDRKGCVFLKDNKCSIYDVRPTQCRTYPYWSRILVGEEEWNREGATRCEGINHPKGLTIPGEDILHNLIVTQVHQQGLGPDWEWDDAIEYLKESQQADPALVHEFEKEFFSTHYSEVVYESDKYKVVDTTMPSITPLSASGGVPTSTSNTETTSRDGDRQPTPGNLTGNPLYMDSEVDAADADGAPAELITHRRLVPTVVSSDSRYEQLEAEVRLDLGGISDHLHLCSKAHAVLSSIARRCVPSPRATVRVAIVGDSGAVLSTHLAKRYDCQVDYFLDKKDELATIAQSLFGANFEEGSPVTLKDMKDVGKGNLDSEYPLLFIDRPENLPKGFKMSSLAKLLQRSAVVAVSTVGTVDDVRVLGSEMLKTFPTLLPPKVLLVEEVDVERGIGSYVVLTTSTVATVSLGDLVSYIRTGEAS